MRWVLIVLLCIPAMTTWAAVGKDFDRHEDIDDADIERRSFEDLQRKAAAYRVERSHVSPSAADEAGARHHLERAQLLFEAEDKIWHLWRSCRTAEKGFKKYPYTSLTGELLHQAMIGYIARRKLNDVEEKLIMLWFYLPDYPRMGQAMEQALGAAEGRQRFATSINLDAEDPDDVIDIQGKSSLEDVNKVFRFLSLHGDRETVAPRAELGLARSLLLSGGRDIYAARRSYERFLESYPTHELTFPALTEHALSYLVGYRGDDYDNGALVYAAAIIDQAELETRGDEAKARTVQAYRKRIRAWQQDRDLRIARWYRGRSTIALQWLKMPPGLISWQDGARYYYQAVIARDSGSAQARAAERELKDIPATPPRAIIPSTTPGAP
ncbi:MAG: hypothetical protein H0V44_12740 [Planctomycetes bacterium]|nr:hypothetical protein [Planctomycetota bacterium]